jgi:hypothetical protein
MKNIHIIPTDKPSRLVLETKNSNLFITSTYFKNDLMKYQNIYITSDEQIKDGDWVLYDKKYIRKVDKTFNKQNMDWNVLNTDKIILTTDPDLIKDGVQAIDDEFLEWFVKNPSCEEVKVINNETGNYREFDSTPNLLYKIIIPQEENEKDFYKIGNFHENCDEGCKYHCTKGNTQIAECLECHFNNTSKEQIENGWEEAGKQTEGINSPTVEEFLEAQTQFKKQETLEEAAEKHWKMQYIMALDESTKPYIIEDFIAGAKSDAARDYWFEQFKKK